MVSLGFILRGVVKKGKGADWALASVCSNCLRCDIHLPGAVFLSIPVLMAPGPAASVLPENLPEMQILRPYLGWLSQNLWRWGPKICFNNPEQGLQGTPALEKAHFTDTPAPATSQAAPGFPPCPRPSHCLYLEHLVLPPYTLVLTTWETLPHFNAHSNVASFGKPFYSSIHLFLPSFLPHMVDISSVPGSVIIVGESATILEEAVRKVGKDQKMEERPWEQWRGGGIY